MRRLNRALDDHVVILLDWRHLRLCNSDKCAYFASFGHIFVLLYLYQFRGRFHVSWVF